VSGVDSSRNQAQKKRVMESHGKRTPAISTDFDSLRATPTTPLQAHGPAWHEVLALPGSW